MCLLPGIGNAIKNQARHSTAHRDVPSRGVGGDENSEQAIAGGFLT